MLDALGDRTIPCDCNSPLYSAEELSREYLSGLQQQHLRILQAISAGNVADARNDACSSHGVKGPLYEPSFNAAVGRYVAQTTICAALGRKANAPVNGSSLR